MSASTAIDLTRVPPPDLIESLDFETILGEMLTDLRRRDPVYTAITEADPAYKVLEVAAYRELLLRARVNDAARAVLLATAMEADLDQVAANFNVERQLITPADDSVIPPTPAVFEKDERLRLRAQLRFEGLSTAGAIGGYEFHTLAVSPLIKDVDVSSPAPGEVLITLLSIHDDGSVQDDLINAVTQTVTAESVRPLTDHVTVRGADVLRYEVSAELTFYPGPDASLVRDRAEQALRQYVEDRHRLGNDITLSGLYAALHQEGVQNVRLITPQSTLVVDNTEAAFCEHISVTAAGIDQ